MKSRRGNNNHHLHPRHIEHLYIPIFNSIIGDVAATAAILFHKEISEVQRYNSDAIPLTDFLFFFQATHLSVRKFQLEQFLSVVTSNIFNRKNLQNEPMIFELVMSIRECAVEAFVNSSKERKCTILPRMNVHICAVIDC